MKFMGQLQAGAIAKAPKFLHLSLYDLMYQWEGEDVLSLEVSCNQDVKKRLKVLRPEKGEEFLLLFLYEAFLVELISFNKRKFLFKVKEKYPLKDERKLKFNFYLSLIKNLNLYEGTIAYLAHFPQVNKIFFVKTKRSYRDIDWSKVDKYLRRFRKIAAKSCEISRNLFLPQFEFLDDFYPPSNLIVLHTNTFQRKKVISWKELRKKLLLSLEVSFLIGPEGGFSEDELETWSKEDIYFYSFPDIILKAEYAPIYLMTILYFGINQDKEGEEE